MRLIQSRKLDDKDSMSDWLHNLPVPLMAPAIFEFTYLLAAVIFAGVALAATEERAKSLKAISNG
ncbi:hypothetical protein [Bradyrhizobium japonicum]|uniref:hypothetical protein n=1 Tax=Bradyrhizobium japonicum TaxID=375 RepID=UPI001BA6F1AB|nr:hypothetical protein [Bradyrhizobium japonicum]MBR0962082.1 hypothetical protein [Bradyrhizobium japonicum]